VIFADDNHCTTAIFKEQTSNNTTTNARNGSVGMSCRRTLTADVRTSHDQLDWCSVDREDDAARMKRARPDLPCTLCLSLDETYNL